MLIRPLFALGLLVCFMTSAQAQRPTPRSMPQPTTPEEQVAELGEALAFIDLLEGLQPCPATGSVLHQAFCAREKERTALWRARHSILCKDLKIQGGQYGCK